MELQHILQRLQISELNEMQKAVLDNYDSSKDFILHSPTGTGKTLAFTLLLGKHLQADTNGTQAFIVVPTRELALQIEQVVRKVHQGFKTTCVYGGNDTKTERNKLREAPSILIGTPGRITYHLERGHINTQHVHSLVLDEFDKSLEFGFHGQMVTIIQQLTQLRHRVLTSATKMDEIPDFTGITEYTTVDFSDNSSSVPNLQMRKVIATAQHKLKALFQLLCTNGDKKTIIFCNHRDAVDHISNLLEDRELIHDVFHGGLEQSDRELALLKFRNNSNRILITTDLAARGLDIPEVDVIIHYQLPYKEDAFIHRNGRTARMQASGEVFIILKPDEDYPYIDSSCTELKLSDDLPLPPDAPFATLYITGGKKDKINKVDIVGFMFSLPDVEKDDIGLIEVKEKESFAAVKRSSVLNIIKNAANGKIKGKKVKIGRT
ncbi:DEAD/DEAH box helicase [Sphingobacterium deserti]|uniref:ATP-independent RNA helicase n=1 Tax=Sphingobacterium deserti TaxID=1229276 RepID=A0A0B8T5I9_9SPHI|nr:DEAD/DEAH box helicase [Sphingobacterium deserti]KGE12909.1 ATP-independent RNA helicase [Sphingobacterium deserti]